MNIPEHLMIEIIKMAEETPYSLNNIILCYKMKDKSVYGYKLEMIIIEMRNRGII